MHIGITGSTGMIGQALTARLEAAGHRVTALHRGPGERFAPGDAAWDPASGWIADGALDGCDAVVHLAGASIGEGRWTEGRKRVLWDSRVPATRLLVDHLGMLPNPPRALISVSAVGYYGDRGEAILDEDAGAGEGFLPELVTAWETEARRAEEHGIRVVTPRLGVVLTTEGGALPRMLTPIKFGVGGPLGSGKQWIPWVTLTDVLRAFEFLLEHEERGAFNVVAPQAVRNKDFIKAVARELGRPWFFPTPGFGLRLLLGQAADELLLLSQHIVSDRLQAAGFEFAHPTLDAALPAVLDRQEVRAAA